MKTTTDKNITGFFIRARAQMGAMFFLSQSLNRFYSFTKLTALWCAFGFAAFLLLATSLPAKENSTETTVSHKTPHKNLSEIKGRLTGEKNFSRRLKIYDEIAEISGAEAKTAAKDKDAKIRAQAALALGRDKETINAAPTLKDLAENDADLDVRTNALQSLGSQQEGLEDLERILRNSSEPLAVREAAASGLALFSDLKAVEILKSARDLADGELKEHIEICLQSTAAYESDLTRTPSGRVESRNQNAE